MKRAAPEYALQLADERMYLRKERTQSLRSA